MQRSNSPWPWDGLAPMSEELYMEEMAKWSHQEAWDSTPEEHLTEYFFRNTKMPRFCHHYLSQQLHYLGFRHENNLNDLRWDVILAHLLEEAHQNGLQVNLDNHYDTPLQCPHCRCWLKNQETLMTHFIQHDRCRALGRLVQELHLPRFPHNNASHHGFISLSIKCLQIKRPTLNIDWGEVLLDLATVTSLMQGAR